MKKLNILLSSMVAFFVLACQQAGAATISDDFNRTATTGQTASSDPNAIGTNYTIASGTWLIGPGAAPAAGTYLQASAAGIMFQNEVQTLNTGGNSFTLSANVLAAASADAARTGGLVFNYQDTLNYNVVRFGINSTTNVGIIQFVSVVNGSNVFVETSNISSGLVVSSYYALSISSSTTIADTFTYSLSALGATDSLYSNTVTVAGTTLSDGYSGFYRDGGGTIRFDEYELTTVIPEPASSAAFLLGAIVVVIGFSRYRRHSR